MQEGDLHFSSSPKAEPVKQHADASLLVERLSSNDSSPSLSSSIGCPSGESDSVICNRMKRIVSSIYSEFETMIEAYGLPAVQRLMPLVVELLENLDELYKDQVHYHAEVGQLREQNTYLNRELEVEKHRRKQSELRLFQAEEAFDDDKKSSDDKIETLNGNIRQIQVKYQTTCDQVSRLEAKEADWRKENSHLHERVNELRRANFDLSEQLKSAYQFDSRSSSRLGVALPRQSSRLVGGDQPMPKSDSFSQLNTSWSPSECTFDATSGGFGFDEMPTNDPEDNKVPLDEEIALPVGMRKEIDTLIKENMELMETKNALNVVKDDLLAKVDLFSCENASLHESLAHITRIRAGLQTELSSTDQLLNETRTELAQLREKLAKETEKSESTKRKRFTHAEMARVLSERNQYKERLMELQEAVRLSETLRSGHLDLLEPPSNRPSKSPTPSSSASRPLSSLQAFFAAFLTDTTLADTVAENGAITPRAEVEENHKAPVKPAASALSQTWLTLSRRGARPPVYGWSTGLDSSSVTARSVVVPTGGPVEDIPVPVQCRSIGGMFKRQLEVIAVVLVRNVTKSHSEAEAAGCDSGQPDIWLVGRGPNDTSPTTPTTAAEGGSRGGAYVGQVMVYGETRFSKPVASFELESGFMPMAAVLVTGSPVPPSAASDTLNDQPTSEHTVVQIEWKSFMTGGELQGDRVVLSSNDGRFFVFQASLTAEGGPILLTQFSFLSKSLAASHMTSLGHRICLTVSNPKGTSQLMCLYLYSGQSTVASTRHELISLPGDCPSVGPVMMASSVEAHGGGSTVAGVEQTTGGNGSEIVWLGTAGGGHCHCFSAQLKRFTVSLKLPEETPCLHAIAVQPVTGQSIWLAVSGGPPAPAPSSSATELPTNCQGTARLLVFDALLRTLLRQLDLTSALSSMIASEGVTDPIDLTLGRLLLCPRKNTFTVWFTTRSGLIGRIGKLGRGTSGSSTDLSKHVSKSVSSFLDVLFKHRLPLAPEDSCQQVEVLKPSSILLSCHSYRRPNCHLIPILDEATEPSAEASGKVSFVVALGHDYADLRPPLGHPSSPKCGGAGDSEEIRGLCRQMDSGAHAIVWRFDTK